MAGGRDASQSDFGGSSSSSSSGGGNGGRESYGGGGQYSGCLLYTSPSPRDGLLSRMPSSA